MPSRGCNPDQRRPNTQAARRRDDSLKNQYAHRRRAAARLAGEINTQAARRHDVLREFDSAGQPQTSPDCNPRRHPFKTGLLQLSKTSCRETQSNDLNKSTALSAAVARTMNAKSQEAGGPRLCRRTNGAEASPSLRDNAEPTTVHTSGRRARKQKSRRHAAINCFCPRRC
jgi:hypothetical protein